MEELQQVHTCLEQEKVNQQTIDRKILIKVNLYAMFNTPLYLINTIELKHQSTFINQSNKGVFSEAIRNALRQGYIDFHNLHMDIIYPFVDNILSDFPEKKMYEAYNKLNLLFSSGFGANYLSIRRLKSLIERLETVNDNDFKCLLRDIGFTEKHDVFLAFKIALVNALKKYIDNVNRRLKTLQESMPDLTLDNLNSYFLDIERYMFEKPQLRQERNIIELMRIHALYPQYQVHARRLILKEAKPQYIVRGEQNIIINGREFVAPKYYGETQPVNLLTAAQTLKDEGLYLAHIKSPGSLGKQAESQPKVNSEIAVDKEKQRSDEDAPQGGSEFIEPIGNQKNSLENTVKLFSHYGSVLNEFEGFSDSPQYKDERDKFYVVAKVDGILNNAKTVQDYVNAYELMEPYINRHKHIKWDSFFGNKITRTWNSVIKQIRDRALEALRQEVNELNDLDEKIKRLQEACQMPLFNEHRNNHWYTGKIGDTHAVTVIKREISVLEGQRNISILLPRQS